MAVPTEHLKKFVQMVALVIFVVQMAVALQKYLDQPLMSSPGTKALSTVKKPLAITVCRTGQFNYKYAKELKYMSAEYFFGGNISNTSFFSWSGPDGDMTFDETVHSLYNSSLGHVVVEKENFTTKFLLPDGVCYIDEGLPGKWHMIEVEESFGYTVTVTDPAANTNFRVSDDLMTGDTILVKTDLTTKAVVCYRIQLKETSIETRDGSCIEYPNEEYASYADCVDDEAEKRILPLLGCMVPWISRKNQCAGLIPRLPIHKELDAFIRSIFTSTWEGRAHPSDTCPPPCTTMSAHSKYLRTIPSSTLSKNKINLNFDKNVKVEKIVAAYDFGTLLVEIGSSLGLWLGLSVVGVFDVLVITVDHFIKIWKWLRGCFKRDSNHE